MKYITKNKIQVINILKDNSYQHLTIEQIDNLLNKQVPIATLYRIIDSLVNEGIVRKYSLDNNTPACFQYIDDNNHHEHFHLVCTKCGKLFHLECHEVNHLLSHIKDEHGFDVDISKVNLYGICKECQKEDK
ncbi:MAG: transcriptional repressor [Bacilli bacterium]|nr:transcriptional repressor [Bacilli bacterium]